MCPPDGRPTRLCPAISREGRRSPIGRFPSCGCTVPMREETGRRNCLRVSSTAAVSAGYLRSAAAQKRASFDVAVSVPAEAVVTTGRHLARLVVPGENEEGREEESRAVGQRVVGRRSTCLKVPMRLAIVGGTATGITAGREAAKMGGETTPLSLRLSQADAGVSGRRAGTRLARPNSIASSLPTAVLGVSAAGEAISSLVVRPTKNRGHAPVMREVLLEMPVVGRRLGRGLAVLTSKSRRATSLCLVEMREVGRLSASVVPPVIAMESGPAPQGRRVS